MFNSRGYTVYRGGEQTIYLPAFADMLNHAGLASNAAWTGDAKSMRFRIIATTDIQPGTEICINYGDLRNAASFFCSYGFIDSRLPLHIEAFLFHKDETIPALKAAFIHYRGAEGLDHPGSRPPRKSFQTVNDLSFKSIMAYLRYVTCPYKSEVHFNEHNHIVASSVAHECVALDLLKSISTQHQERFSCSITENICKLQQQNDNSTASSMMLTLTIGEQQLLKGLDDFASEMLTILRNSGSNIGSDLNNSLDQLTEYSTYVADSIRPLLV
jgi:hypothetical protein